MSVDQNQAWPERVPVMKALFETVFQKRAIRGLEVGVWYGLGSTQIWLDNCAPGSEFWLVDSWKPYASKEDQADSLIYDYQQMDSLCDEAFASALNVVREFENKKNDTIRVNILRGDSGSCLNFFKDGMFDFIYIDGDHKYSNVKSDIQQAKRLVNRNFGVICGDDLEVMPDNNLCEISKKYLMRDFLFDPQFNFHPGVLAAIYEEFEKVNMKNGFWWVTYINGFPNMDVFHPK